MIIRVEAISQQVVLFDPDLIAGTDPGKDRMVLPEYGVYRSQTRMPAGFHPVIKTAAALVITEFLVGTPL